MSRLPRWLRLAGFCLLIFGAKLWFIETAGSDLPTWDQWDAISEVTLRPWIEGWMRSKEIFHPHNEHRIVTTKLYTLGLFVANGQWDCFLETTANAVIHTSCALILLLLARRWLPGRWMGWFAALLVLLFTLPFSWENTLFGFQVMFYFLLLFSLGHICLTLEGDRFSFRWFVGQISAALAVLTLASGFFSAVAVLAVLGHRFVRERKLTAQQVTSALVAVACGVVGWFMRNDVPAHAYLRAHNPWEMLVQFLELIAWPGTVGFPWALLLWAPALLFIVRRVRSRITTKEDAILLGLMIWILLQCLATAYVRGGSGAVLSPRYLDLLAINVALGFVFLVREFSGKFRLVFAALWLVVVAAGLGQQGRFMWADFIEANIPRQHIQEGHMRDFLRTRDPAHILNKPWGDVPYPVGEVLVSRLTPAIQEIMPPSVRRSVPVSNGAPSAVPPTLPPVLRPIALSTWNLPVASPPFHWRSPILPPSPLPVLRFTFAGDLGKLGRVVIRTASTETLVAPESAPGNRWKTVNVVRPEGDWWIEADPAEAGRWFAFTEPVEVGRWTFVAEKLLKHHFTLMLLGGLLLGAGTVPLLLRRGRA